MHSESKQGIKSAIDSRRPGYGFLCQGKGSGCRRAWGHLKNWSSGPLIYFFLLSD